MGENTISRLKGREYSILTLFAIVLFMIFPTVIFAKSASLENLEKDYERKLDSFGSKNPKTLTALVKLGDAYRDSKDYKMAIKLYERAEWELHETPPTPGLPDSDVIQESLAVCYTALEDYVTAYSIYQYLMAKRERKLGEKDPLTLMTKFNAANSFLAAGDYGNSASLYKKILYYFSKVMGPTSKETFTLKTNLAYSRLQFEHYEEAAEIYKEVLAADKKADPKGIDTLSRKHNLAYCYTGMKNYDEAIKLHKEVLEASRKSMAMDDPFVITAQSDLASLYLREKDYANAIINYEELLSNLKIPPREDYMGKKFRNDIINRLASAYTATGELDKARILLDSKTK